MGQKIIPKPFIDEFGNKGIDYYDRSNNRIGTISIITMGEQPLAFKRINSYSPKEIGVLIGGFHPYEGKTYGQLMSEGNVSPKKGWGKQLLKLMIEDSKKMGAKGINCSAVSTETFMETLEKQGFDIYDIKKKGRSSKAIKDIS